jgi:soluble cytochrome b562
VLSVSARSPAWLAAASTAALAFAGARREIANNTTVGKQFQAGIDTLTGHLHALEATAAAGVLSGFTDAVKALAPLMPAVGRDVAYMSTQLGQIMRSVLPGVVASVPSGESAVPDVR